MTSKSLSGSQRTCLLIFSLRKTSISSSLRGRLFVGPAREAAPRFPENVNVAAAVSLAGVGPDRTSVRVVADPGVSRNTHEVVARGYFGEIRILLQNIPTEANPKTGRIVALGVIKALRNLTAPVVVGC